MVLLLGRQPALHAVTARTDDAADARLALSETEAVSSSAAQGRRVTVLRADDDGDDGAEGLSDTRIKVLGRSKAADEDDGVERSRANLGNLGREELEHLFCGRGQLSVSARSAHAAKPCRRTDDRVKHFRLEHLARNGELAKLETDGRVVRVLNVEAVETEDGLCGRVSSAAATGDKEGASVRTVVLGGTVVGQLVSLGKGMDEGGHRRRLEVHGVVFEAVSDTQACISMWCRRPAAGRSEASRDSHPPQQLFKLEVDKQASRVRPAPHAHLGDLELRELAHQLVDARVDGAASRIAEEETLRRPEVVEGREG